MEQSQKLTPKFFFLSIGSLVALIATVSAFLNLVFAALDHVFPDVLTASYQYGYVSYSYESMRSALAILIIVFPVFLVLTRLWNRATKKGMGHWDETIRKWVIYLILFLASITIIVDLVTLVRYFVSGEITVRFILKVLVTLVTAGIVGWYYILQLRSIDNKKWDTLLLIKSSVLVLAAIIWSFTVMGGPGSQRDLRIDQRRIEDLQNIQYQVINYWQQKEKLPATLDELKNPISSYMVPQDPEFEKGMVYEYKKIDDKKFQLCATFTLPLPKGWVEYSKGGYGGGIMPMRDIAVSSMPYPGGMNDSWDHKEGYTCFDREIDPDLYPPYPKPVKS
jgi:hypothetical protein